MEIVFGQGKGNNYIWDNLLNKIQHEHTERVQSMVQLRDYFDLTKKKVDTTMELINQSEEKIVNMRDVMLNFRKDLTEYYDFFVAQASTFLDEMSKTQMKNNYQYSELKTRIITTEHQIKDGQRDHVELERKVEEANKYARNLSRAFHAEVSKNANRIKEAASQKELDDHAKDCNEKWTKILYQQKDLQNNLKTTDTFVDKFLPFRLFKENSAFLQQVMPED